MMDWVVYVVRFKPSERVGNVEAHQLIQENLNDYRGKSLRSRAMAGLGRCLSAWGERLQNQYDSTCRSALELQALDEV